MVIKKKQRKPKFIAFEICLMLAEKAAEGGVEGTHAGGRSGRHGVTTLHVVAFAQLASRAALQTRDTYMFKKVKYK